MGNNSHIYAAMMLLRLSPFGVVGHGISALGFCSLIEQPLLTEWVSVALILRWTHSIQNELVWFHHIRSRWIILDHSTRMRYFDWINILCLKIGTGLWTLNRTEWFRAPFASLVTSGYLCCAAANVARDFGIAPLQVIQRISAAENGSWKDMAHVTRFGNSRRAENCSSDLISKTFPCTWIAELYSMGH